MDSAFLTCPICYEEFDSAKHIPRIIPTCGHTICSACLRVLLQNQSLKKCPLDAQAFPLELTHVEGFKVNFIINQILEVQLHKELCPDHNEEMNFVCITDQRKICSSCVCETGHQAHKIKTVKAIRSEANSYAKKIKDVLKNVDTCYSEANQTLKEMKTLLLKRIREEFEEARKLLSIREQEITFQINSSFYNQEVNVTDLIGTTSTMRTTLDSQANTLNSFLASQECLKYEEFFQNVQNALANHKTEFDSKAIDEERELIRLKVEEAFQSFKKAFSSQLQGWSEFKFSLEADLFKSLSRGVLKDLPVTTSCIIMETEEIAAAFKMQSHFTFEYDQPELIISTKSSVQKESLIDIGTWKNAKNVSLRFLHSIQDEEDVQILNFICRRLQGTGFINLEFSPNAISEKLIHLLTSTQLQFSTIKISLESCDITNETEFASSLGTILSRDVGLSQIILSLSKAKLSKQFLEALLEDRLTDPINITSFRMFLSETNVSDRDICGLNFNLPHVKRFYLALDDTQITHETIELMAKNSFSSMKCLEDLRLYLSGTKISDTGLDTLLLGLGKLKILTLDLSSTNITNKTLECLAEVMSNFQETLEEFELGIYKANISDKGLGPVFMSLPKITKLYLILSHTEITDKSLELLAQKTLSSTINLKSFHLSITDTKITDQSMQQVFENLRELEELVAELSCTNVTDDSIAPFIIDKLLNSTSLTRFKMTVSDTEVSSDVRAKIQELESTRKVLDD